SLYPFVHQITLLQSPLPPRPSSQLPQPPQTTATTTYFIKSAPSILATNPLDSQSPLLNPAPPLSYRTPLQPQTPLCPLFSQL
ncbi:Uncharacterized protein FKW44_011370, partial [Caligus rogercresseyi]